MSYSPTEVSIHDGPYERQECRSLRSEAELGASWGEIKRQRGGMGNRIVRVSRRGRGCLPLGNAGNLGAFWAGVKGSAIFSELPDGVAGKYFS